MVTETIKIIIDSAQAVAVIVASIVAIYGIDVWRKEAQWKRKYEIAEEALTLFYTVRDTISMIRNPGSHSSEGSTRQKHPDETEGETHILNQAYVVMERYEKEKEVFSKLQALKYRFMAVFGRETQEPFDEIKNVIGRIFYASRRLGAFWLQLGKGYRDANHLEKQLEEMRKYEDIFWESDDDNDEIKIQIENAIQKLEKYCSEIKILNK
jgi:hypothetical protein